jgi:hypothetical protein
MINQRPRDPLLKRFSLKRPLLVNLVFAGVTPRAFQTLLRELGTQLGRLRAAGKRHPASGAASPGIPANGLKLRKTPQTLPCLRLRFSGPFHVADKLREPPLLATYL